jgi:hypothetical protein
MHPKSPFDVEVRTADIETAKKAVACFGHTRADVMRHCNEHIAKTIATMLQARGR